jgi:hypothetical protein
LGSAFLLGSVSWAVFLLGPVFLVVSAMVVF